MSHSLKHALSMMSFHMSLRFLESHLLLFALNGENGWVSVKALDEKKNLWLGAFSHAQKRHFYQFSFAKLISVNLFQVRQWVTQCVNFALMVISPRVAPPPSRVSLTRTAQNWASRHWDGARPLQTASVALRTRRQRWSALIITLCARLVRTYALSCWAWRCRKRSYGTF